MMWRAQIFLLLILGSAYFAYHIGKRSKSGVAGILAGWVLISGANVIANPKIVLTIMELRLKLVASRSFMVTAMLLYFVSNISSYALTGLMFLVQGLAALNCGLLLSVGHGLFNADSMDATFIAMTIPMSLYINNKHLGLKWRILVSAIPILTVFRAVSIGAGGSTPVFVLATQVASYLVATRHSYFILPTFASLFGFGYWARGEAIYSSPDRISNWKLFMSWWWENANIYLGSGSGTFQWLGPAIQNRADNLYVWMHNDFMQIAFEQGLLGIALAVALLVTCLRRAWERPWLVASIGGVCFSMLTQFPLRFAASQLFLLLLIRLSLVEEEL